MRVLITGAAGGIGTMLRTRLATPGRTLRLLDTAPLAPEGTAPLAPEKPAPPAPEDTAPPAPESTTGIEVFGGSVTDPDVLAAACDGVDAVVHLAGIPGEAAWEDILHVNVHGTRCVLEAARRAGARRVVLASSNHAVGWAPRADAADGPLADDTAPRPDTYYGWSKAAIESLGRLYADRYGMDVLCLRIGSCFGHPGDARGLASWLSPDDVGRLVEACLTAPDPGFRIVWGVSANTRSWWSSAGGAAIGYRPADDAEVFAAEIPGADAPPDPAERLGGTFCAIPLGGATD